MCFKLPLFSDINVSKGSVATHFRCGGVFRYHFTANLSLSLTMNLQIGYDLTKLLPWIWWSSFFVTQCTNDLQWYVLLAKTFLYRVMSVMELMSDGWEAALNYCLPMVTFHLISRDGFPSKFEEEMNRNYCFSTSPWTTAMSTRVLMVLSTTSSISQC